MRLLVTGSRDWPYKGFLGRVLTQVATAPYRAAPGLVLVSGACPTGADMMAERWAEICGWEIERHPADWHGYGKKAGSIRNREMVDLGADVCVAFILNASKGATMTADMAEEAGIRTLRINRSTETEGRGISNG